ncbi:MAG: SUMF1/EgtB/PvdO family nonheme iron enzyme [Scytonema sp. PMC 1069.18]|nr:SUMF1/EgtB/PvdO family nonheme iron enzyme [Scytonema sp. PMC 1069.18]MEC4882615.1 SUMF1/EgtB/PvdO family nonheme iron enzyme [Scytonema sp. PMC 1070.18]
MTPNDPHLLELFWGLREAGLPLRMEDYQLLCQAWEKGFRPTNDRELRQLCRRLWVKSLAEKQCFEEYFDRYLDQYQELPSSPAKSPKSLRTIEPISTSIPRDTSRNKESQQVTAAKQVSLQSGEFGISTTNSSKKSQEVAQAVSFSSSQLFTLNNEYFPVTRRQMRQAWRKLRQPLREGTPTELDISATVKRISQQGFLLEPVLIPNRVNQIQILLLIDRSNSMVPFAPLTEQLIETAQQEWRLGEIKTYYFRNVPKDFLYSDPDLLQKHPLSEIIPHLHKNHTVVLICSDGGAARGGFNGNRVILTEKFLFQIRPVVKNVGWLNPIPVNRWSGTTANWVAKLVSMYPFELTAWWRMMEELRGRQTLVKEYIYFDSGLKGDLQFVEQVRSQLDKLLQKLPSTPPDEFNSYQSAARDITDFAKEGQAYLYLAYHAAFPLALTPDLLYYLRENFPYDQEGNRLNIPWLAVPDILLSNLCHPAGQPLYEMDSTVRHLLLKLLQADERFGNRRLEQLSECLLFYLQKKLKLENTNLDSEDFGEKPEWIALAYTKPNELACNLAKMLEQIYAGDKAEKVKTTSLTATFAEPLTEAGFQPLLTFAQGWGRLARGYEEGAREIFDELPSEPEIEGVKLKIPGRNGLSKFSFDVVTVNARGEIVKREQHQAQYFIENLPNGVSLEMVSIPGGTFLMGAPEGEEGSSSSERPQHEVTVRPFFMGKYPITQAQWRAVANLPQINRELDPDPSRFKGDDRPVERIYWYEAVEFCDRLSKYIGKKYRLPNEAEWEYACRAGTTTPFHFGKTITPELANYDGNYTYGSGSKGKYRKQTTPVGSFQIANSFGLFDMHGNIWEWCADGWHRTYEGAPSKSVTWRSNDNDNQRMLRGGSWDVNPSDCRSAYRNCNGPDYRFDNIGFRVVVSVAEIL